MFSSEILDALRSERLIVIVTGKGTFLEFSSEKGQEIALWQGSWVFYEAARFLFDLIHKC